MLLHFREVKISVKKYSLYQLRDMLQGKEWGEFSCQGSLNMPDYCLVTVIDADLYTHKHPKGRRLSLRWKEKGDACCSSHLVYTT